MSEFKVISAKVPDELYKELALRVPEGDRSDFIREAILDKLQKTPKANKLLELEGRMNKIESQIGDIRKYLADLELLTYGSHKVNPYSFCLDDIDRKIVDHIFHYKGATTPELAENIKINRWMALNRLRRMQKASEKECGKAVIEYYAGEKSGKKKAWWINEELISEE